jgi:replication factor C subunit 1
MDEYYINKEDWDAILELGLGANSGDVILKMIQSSTKSAFTRTFNKTSHHTPFAQTTSLGGGRKAGSELKTADAEEAVEDDTKDPVEDDDADESDEDVSKNKMIKAKKPSGRATSSGASGVKRKESARGGKTSKSAGKAK